MANPKPRVTVRCPRCNGEGYIAHYSHVMDGICHKCHGMGTTTVVARPGIEAWSPVYEWKYIIPLKADDRRNTWIVFTGKTQDEAYPKLVRWCRSQSDAWKADYNTSTIKVKFNGIHRP